MFQNLDGATKGINSFCLPVDQQIIGCDMLPVAALKKSIVNPRIRSKYLKHRSETYSRYFPPKQNTKLHYRIDSSCYFVNPDYLQKQIDPFVFYITTECPLDEPKIIVHFIPKSYTPVWFEIKLRKTFRNGPIHVHRVIGTSGFWPDIMKQVVYVDPVIEQKTFFAQHENLLVVMIFDQRIRISEHLPRRVLKAREWVYERENNQTLF